MLLRNAHTSTTHGGTDDERNSPVLFKTHHNPITVVRHVEVEPSTRTVCDATLRLSSHRDDHSLSLIQCICDYSCVPNHATYTQRTLPEYIHRAYIL